MDATTPQGLFKLPDEILLNISYRIHLESRNPRTERGFQASSTTIRDIALVCSTLLPIAREVLYAEPVIYAWPPTGLTPALLFTRTLLERPEIGKNVRNLDVRLPNLQVGPRGAEYFEKNVRSQKSQLFFHVDALARQRIKSLGLPIFLEDMWLAALRTHYPHSLIGVLLTLTPHLDRFSITPEHGEILEDEPTNCLSALFGAPARAEFETLLSSPHLQSLQNLKTLKVTGGPLTMIRELHLLPQLTTLELTLTWNEYSYDTKMMHRISSAATSYNLARIRALSVRLRNVGNGLSTSTLQYLTTLFHSAHSLTHLALAIHLYYPSAEPSTRLLELLHPFRTTLESLTLGGNVHFTPAADPHTAGLAQLPRLRRLVAHALDVLIEDADDSLPLRPAFEFPFAAVAPGERFSYRYCALPGTLEELVLWLEARVALRPEGGVVPATTPRLKTLEFHLGVLKWDCVLGKRRMRLGEESLGEGVADVKVEAFEYGEGQDWKSWP